MSSGKFVGLMALNDEKNKEAGQGMFSILSCKESDKDVVKVELGHEASGETSFYCLVM